MKKNSILSIMALAIILGISSITFTSCGGGKDKPAPATVDSTKASFKILGTWVSVDDPNNKAVFTTDSVTDIAATGSQTHPYKWVSEKEIEVKDKKAQIAINGDSLTMTVDNKPIILIREGSASAALINTDPVNTNLTPEQKIFKDKLTGTWVYGRSLRLGFTRDGRILICHPLDSVNIYFQSYYRITSDSTLEWLDKEFNKLKYTMSFGVDNKTMTWINSINNIYGNLGTFEFVSENADADFSNSLQSRICANWVGIAGTASANERLSVFFPNWLVSTNGESFSSSYFEGLPDGTVKVEHTRILKVTATNDEMTVVENGVEKKYTRYKGFGD